MTTEETTSTRPYLIRALYEWCTDNGLTPHLAVRVDGSVQVPREFVKQGEIVLNISFDATSALKLGDEFIEFKGRFGGVPRDILVPINQVMAIYARENGQGMSFPMTSAGTSLPIEAESTNSLDSSDTAKTQSKTPAVLTSVSSTLVLPSDSTKDPKGTSKNRSSRPTLKSVK